MPASISSTSTTTPQVPWWARRPARAPTIPAAGSVSSQATSMRRAVDHRTSSGVRATPVPMIAPAVTWVVERPNPKCDEARMATIDDVSAVKPCGVSMSAKPRPIVRMMRQPPV